MRRASKVDANHAAIREYLRGLGWIVFDSSTLGHGFPDLVISNRGRTVLIEVKDGSLPPSQRKLTPDESAFFSSWQGEVYVVESIEDCYATLEGRDEQRERKERDATCGAVRPLRGD